MNDQTARLERRRLEAVAREYKAKGYRVVTEPSADDLPAALQSFHPDLVAYNSEESVVIEVKSRQTLVGAESLPRLAHIVDALPGWRLELVVVNPRSSIDQQPGVQAMSDEEIAQHLATVRHLIPQQREAAILLAWSATEATLRLLAQHERIRLERDDPSFIVKKLYSYGVLGDDDYEILNDAIRSRDVIIHGYQTSQLDDSLIQQLIATVERLLHTIPEMQGAR